MENEHDWACQEGYGRGNCKHPDHFKDMTPHALFLFKDANPGNDHFIYAGWGFWNALAKKNPTAKSYKETEK